MERGTWILVSMAYYIISFIVWFAVEGASQCLVTAPAVAVIAGDNVSLTCTTSTYISGWKRGSDYSSASIVFQAYSLVGKNTSTPRLVAGGYLVDDSDDSQAILIMSKAATVQADRYYCFCNLAQPSAASVTVLVSKPTFSTINQITDGGPVNMTCSVSLNGTADILLTITDVSGIKVADKSVVGTYPSNSTDLRVINLDYNTTANPSINQTYSCQVNLSDNSQTIYSEKVVTSVPVSVRNVRIIPVEKTRCSNGSKCEINQKIQCIADGNPYPVAFQWISFHDGNQLNSAQNTSDLFTLTSTGNYTVQCTAFNVIGGFTYNSTSEYYKAEVTVEGPPTSLPDSDLDEKSKTSLIVGLVVGLGGGLIVIIVSVIVVFIWKRKKRGTVCCNPDGNNQSVELNKTDTNSKTKDNGVKKNGHTTPAGVLNKGSDEVTVVENDLYSREQNAKKIDPSDGGYAAINEVMPHGR